MNVTQRGELSAEDQRRLLEAKAEDGDASEVRGRYRAVVVEMLEKSSYREVGRLTGLSTNTLQRWRREARS